MSTPAEVIEPTIDVNDIDQMGFTDVSKQIPLSQFIDEFGEGLLDAIQQQNPPVYCGPEDDDSRRDHVMEHLKRVPFPAQKNVVQAVSRLLIEEDEKSAIINAEMGTGKTMMAIAVAAVLQHEGYRRHLVISPPHLVYKWRREILETVDNANVWILNGPDTLTKLLLLRESMGAHEHDGPEFYILGRVRMRMGFHWCHAFVIKRSFTRVHVDEGNPDSATYIKKDENVACPRCHDIVRDSDGHPVDRLIFMAGNRRHVCSACGDALWSLMRPQLRMKSRKDMVIDAMCQIPTIGPKTADRLVTVFGEDLLGGMLADNVYEFINLMDADGELVFHDKQARRMERAMANIEINFGQGGYQPTEFIKRYLPDRYFDLMIVDEGHEYKNDSSAQGQAMGVLANKVSKILLLTGTLMGGYADDLFFLLWRIMSRRMREDGFVYNRHGSLGTASMAFMREHGILKDIYSETNEGSHRTSRGKKMTVRTVKGPGFGPQGIVRYVLPYTVFLKLKDIGTNVLPPYQEHYIEVPMTDEQRERYDAMERTLTSIMKEALRKGDNSLLGVVINTLLAWPDTCFRAENVTHPRTRDTLFFSKSLFADDEVAPKEQELIRLCKKAKAQGKRVLVYTIYTGKRDTASRLKSLLQQEGVKAAVLRSSVETHKREDWFLDQVDRGVDAVICNPELVKTGLDLLDFPEIVFMQSGYNVYTLLQAARRSWRIGQKQDVNGYFLGYADSAQTTCLSLMASKIAVSQSTSGDMPDTGLDMLNQNGDSVEVALAKQLLAA